MGFRTKLAERQKEANSLVCVGLDPLPEKLPKCIHKNHENAPWEAFAQWMSDIVDATAPYTSMFKPQRAHYEAFPQGRKILISVDNYIHMKYQESLFFWTANVVTSEELSNDTELPTLTSMASME
jgi:orotidine-5'-phosphate decarboxylase